MWILRLLCLLELINHIYHLGQIFKAIFVHENASCYYLVGSNGEFEKQLDFNISKAIDLYTI